MLGWPFPTVCRLEVLPTSGDSDRRELEAPGGPGTFAGVSDDPEAFKLDGGVPAPTEAADVIVVGARVAGCATSIALSRAGKKVVVLDRTRFPSNTLSTHGFWPSAISELAILGALPRVMAYEPPKIRNFLFHHMGYSVRKPFNSVAGFDFAMCMPRTQLDTALVETTREAGADVRERTTVTELVREGGRVAGVRFRRHDGVTGEIRAPLLVGADGRRSTVAEAVGVAEPYRGSRNGRGFAYWYMDDPKLGTPWRETGTFWRTGDSIVLTGPMPGGRLCVVCMVPVERIPTYRRDPEGAFEELLRDHRHLADRVQGATRPTRVFTTAEIPAFFRASSGPGWALAGDAGHFKDPSIAQGIRDALHFGRRLGEVAAPVLRRPAELDAALAAWEHERDRECLSTYHFANRETRVDREQPILLEALRTFTHTGGGLEFADVLSRRRDYEEVVSPGQSMVWLVRALSRPGADRRQILKQVGQEMRINRDSGIELMLDRFRPTRQHASEQPGLQWPPRRAASEDRTLAPAEPDLTPA